MSESAEQTAQLRKGLLVSVTGPSGVGKGNVIERVRMRIQDKAHSISVTSRPRRDCETDGVEYFFRSDKEFKRMMAKGEILEFAIYLNNYYGTPVKPLEKLVGEGKDVLFDLTVSGSLALKEKFPESVTIFLLPPSVSDLRDRRVRRGTETIDVIERRLLEASVEIPKADLFDYVVINDDLERASNRIIAIIEAEKHRYFRQIGIEDRILNG